jgi:hypothetical protein
MNHPTLVIPYHAAAAAVCAIEITQRQLQRRLDRTPVDDPEHEAWAESVSVMQAAAEAIAAAAPGLPRLFDAVWCSQCGRAIGAGDHGYSHCEDHTNPTPPL